MPNTTETIGEIGSIGTVLGLLLLIYWSVLLKGGLRGLVVKLEVTLRIPDQCNFSIEAGWTALT